MLDSEILKVRSPLLVFEILLTSQLFVFKEFCMEKRLSNIFKTTNVMKSTRSF